MGIFFSILSADYVEVYKNKGIEAVEKLLLKELESKNYWENYFKDKDIRFGYFESINYVLIADKVKKELDVFKKEDNGFEKIFGGNIYVGKNSGDKEFEGDLRTPTGAYEIEHIRKDMGEFYGPLAFVTDYPNMFDKLHDKNGHGIWIHGMPLDENTSRDDFTQGCIALNNTKLLDLQNSINYQKSILLIDDGNISYSTVEELSEIFSFIYKWKSAWKFSHINDYLNCYSDEFKRFDGMNFDEFKDYKTRILGRNEDKTIEFSNINIYPYPNSLNKRMFRVIMDEDYSTRYHQFKGKKELYLELKDEKIKILAEG